MRNYRRRQFYNKGQSDYRHDKTWKPPTGGLFDPDPEGTQAARTEYEQGWNDAKRLDRSSTDWSFGTVAVAVVAFAILAAIAGGIKDMHAGKRASLDEDLSSQNHCSWQWRRTGPWVSNHDATGHYEKYYTGRGFWDYYGMWHPEWRSYWVVDRRETWRRDWKQEWVCS